MAVSGDAAAAASLPSAPPAAAATVAAAAVVAEAPCQPSPATSPAPTAEPVVEAVSEGAATPSAGVEGPKKKRISVLGMQISATEQGAKKALIGAGALLIAVNGIGLPFILPKLTRRFLGAPYLPMKRTAVDVLFDRVLPTWAANSGRTVPGLRLVDFGSGDGRVVAAAASRGMKAVGYELNPYLVLWSWLRTRGTLAAAPAPGSGELRWANAWTAELRNVDVVTIYGRPGDGLMERAAAKCEAELPPTAAVVSHHFDVPGWERLLVQDVEGLKLYDLSRRGFVAPGAAAAMRQGVAREE
mmetsp:Transcript_113692/g.294440  ORF Transcript_113692/g.294440 Transcript_113692/m.294440 type:complete len:300 (-) Transcript_113692:85-984(-)